MKVLLLITIIALIEIRFSPRLDLTAEEKLILWYSDQAGSRKYIVLW